MKFRPTSAGETVLATVTCVIDAPLLKLMEQDYQPAGTAELADWWQPKQGAIRYRLPEQITAGSLVRVTAVRIIRAYSEKECRMIIIELEDGKLGQLKMRTPEEVAVRIARFLGACSGIISDIKSRWPDDSGIL